MRPFSAISGMAMMVRLFRRTLNRSSYVEILRGKNIQIRKANEKLCLHYDGEPGGTVDAIKIAVQPRSLRIITPEDHGRI
jgi:diacylglycerol kinase family enzyme